MDDWRKVMEVNLYGSMNMTQAVVPQMKKQKDGSIVMINTMATRRPNQLEAGYAVSKGALKTAVQYLAEDLGPSASASTAPTTAGCGAHRSKAISRRKPSARACPWNRWSM
jgi:NAD(P)-dependent dehydrogenase (short-subunit alcohol dehydrogenase family)